MVGCLLFYGLGRKLGWHNIINELWAVGWYFWGAFAIVMVGMFIISIGWFETLKYTEKPRLLFKMYLGKLAAEAVNNVTPANFIGGDPFRVYFLKNEVSMTEGAASVVIDRTLQALSTLAISIIGVIVFFMYVPSISYKFKISLGIFIIVLICLMTFIIVHQHKGLFSLLINIVKKLKIKKSFSERTIHKISKLDEYISTFYNENRKGFIWAAALHFVGRISAVAEIYYIGWVIDSNLTLFGAIILSTLTSIINFIFAIIPGAIGILEGAYGGASTLIGISPSTGVAIQLVRRIRALVITLIGFTIIAAYEKKGLRINNEQTEILK